MVAAVIRLAFIGGDAQPVFAGSVILMRRVALGLCEDLVPRAADIVLNLASTDPIALLQRLLDLRLSVDAPMQGFGDHQLREGHPLFCLSLGAAPLLRRGSRIGHDPQSVTREGPASTAVWILGQLRVDKHLQCFPLRTTQRERGRAVVVRFAGPVSWDAIELDLAQLCDADTHHASGSATVECLEVFDWLAWHTDAGKNATLVDSFRHSAPTDRASDTSPT